MKKILYISNYRSQTVQWKSRLYDRFHGERIGGQDGFFAASLYATYKVHEASLDWANKNSGHINRNYDAIFINAKSAPNNQALTAEQAHFIRQINIPKILVSTNAKAGVISCEELLDSFDLVFKREHFEDLDRYDISEANKAKLRTTMLSCPMVRLRTNTSLRWFDVKRFGYRQVSTVETHDVCFAGKDTAAQRAEALEVLSEAGISYFGGILIRKKPPAHLALKHQTQALRGDDYTNSIRDSKINLAIEGIGEFTYRHLELLCCSAFMLSSPCIRGLKLPMPLKEGKHYICYEDYDDLVDKVRGLLTDKALRDRIASAGRQVFEEYYDFKKHGSYINQQLFG